MYKTFPLENREDYKNFIIYIEKNFNVNEWKVNDIHLWPMIRIYLFFYLIKVVEISEKKIEHNPVPKHSTKFKGVKRIKELLIFYKWLYKLPKKNTVFVGADVHRIDYNGKKINRFFDSLVSNSKDFENNYLYLEYRYNHKFEYYNKELVIHSENRINNFKKFYNLNLNIELNCYDKFLDFLSNIEITREFSNIYNIDRIEYLAEDIIYRVSFYEKILRNIAPKEVYMLCYYGSATTYSIIAAANRLNIKTIEMQHGPQPDLHLSYTNWTNIPTEGYSILPRYYYQWDNDSVNHIKSWSDNTKIYHAEKIGHPWINFLENIDVKIPDENFILYCLQPEPVKLSLLFNDKIIETIKKSQNKWYIRLHPRQMDKMDDVLNIINSNFLQECVNIEEATSLPLPNLIKKSVLVVTHSSGSVIEAEMLNKKTIILNELGVKYHEGAILRNAAKFIDNSKDDFPIIFEEYLNDH